MKFKNTMIVVKDMDRAVSFYCEVLGLRKLIDLKVHVVLTGGLALQTEKSWRGFTNCEISYGANDSELYFEEADFDGFVERLQQRSDIVYVHPLLEHSWGQRVVRLYDPDHHIVEIGESLQDVCRRFAKQGMTAPEIAARMDIPLPAINRYLQRH